MSSKVLLLSLVLFILTYQISVAQNSPEEMVNKFFDLYKKNGSDKAIDYLFATNKYAKDNQEAIDQLKSNLKNILAVDGPFWGYDLLLKKMAGENFVMLTLLVKHDRDPLTFRIVFYKPHNEWQVQNFKFDNKMDDELEEASKGYRIKDTPK
jgi:hypothetical protein